MTNDPQYTLGLDLGKSYDHTALALVESDFSTDELRLVGLHRFPLGTAYTDILRALEHRLTSPALAGHVRLAVDATGLGAPFVDQFREQLPGIDMYAIKITSGSSLGGDRRNPHVPKQDLIATISLILETGGLRIAAEMRETPTLIDELLSYQHIQTDHGNDTYGASAGHHDDLVLALSLALWLIENRPISPPQRSGVAPGDIPGLVKMGEGLLFPLG